MVPIAVSALGLIGRVGSKFLAKMRRSVAKRRGISAQEAPDFELLVEAYAVHGTAEALLRAYGTPDGTSRPGEGPAGAAASQTSA